MPIASLQHVRSTYVVAIYKTNLAVICGRGLFFLSVLDPTMMPKLGQSEGSTRGPARLRNRAHPLPEYIPLA